MAQALDFYLRCNSLKCRTVLNERAVVTTCSHIFCLQCADQLGLSRPTAADRCCPACHASLLNPDDAVSTILNPTEDYKTSVLSGLDPNTIMECAGRALAFWTYQTTQEVFYQEYLGKTLTEKYGTLSTQMDKVVHDANTEISSLQARISDMQLGQDQLHKKNQELVEMYREKSKKHTQVTNLYNLLKSRAMRSQIQSAASDSVAHTLESFSGPRTDSNSFPDLHQSLSSHTPMPRANQHGQFPIDHNGVEQIHRHQKSGSGTGSGNASVIMNQENSNVTSMPPPSRPVSSHNTKLPMATPQHRTHFPATSRPPSRVDYQQQQPQYHNQRTPPGFVSGRYTGPSQGRPLGNSHSPRFNQGGGGFGLSAGMKIGRPSSALQSGSHDTTRSTGFNGRQF
ncbi:hypothetical protein FQN54_006684 [Arachnomyces sp. PD_36]|nr:hypothetical protein FQN54_006684 [Arachnomyces sp. PD_36]